MHTTPLPISARETRLDFWRGLCLADMIVVHLLGYGFSFGPSVDLFFTQFFRFAAGGFIFISGMSVGFIYLPKAKQDFSNVRRRLWRRAGFILAFHFALEISFLLRTPVTRLSRDFLQSVVDVLCFRNGYDLLPFYATMMLVSPLIIALLVRRRFATLALCSALVFALGRCDPYRWTLPIQQTFMPMLWQALFVAGAMAGALLPAYDALRRGKKLAIIASASASLLLVELLAFGNRVGMDLLWHAGWFEKTPLTSGEAARYLLVILAMVLWTDLAWRAIKDTVWARAVATTGAAALNVYAAHIFLVGATVRLAGPSDARSPMHALLATSLCFAAAWLVARGTLSWRAWNRRARKSRWSIASLGPAPRFAVFAAIGVVFAPWINGLVWPEKSASQREAANPPHVTSYVELDEPDAGDAAPPPEQSPPVPDEAGDFDSTGGDVASGFGDVAVIAPT